MHSPKVVVVDYGVGNLRSVRCAVERCGGEVIISSEAEVIAKADQVILPGVGAFTKGMKALHALGLVDVLRESAADGIPILGICLGMQLLFDESEEHGISKGLGIIPGRVIAVPTFDVQGERIKVPHIGWNSLVAGGSSSWSGTILESYSPKESVYFIHSYMAVPSDPKMRIADCLYAGNSISAVVHYKNIVGCQFHPEKSGETGIKIIKDWLSRPNNSVI